MSSEITIFDVQVKSLDEKFKILLDEAEKRNGQRFDAQQEAVNIALIAQEKAVLTAMAAAEKAVTKAENASEKRFESVNEFRKALTDQTATFMSKSEYLTQHKNFEQKLDDLNGRLIAVDKIVGEMRERGVGRSDLGGTFMGVIAILISMAAFAALLLK